MPNILKEAKLYYNPRLTVAPMLHHITIHLPSGGKLFSIGAKEGRMEG